MNWEYQTLEHDVSVSFILGRCKFDPARLNALISDQASQSWELVSTFSLVVDGRTGRNKIILIFRRPLQA